MENAAREFLARQPADPGAGVGPAGPAADRGDRAERLPASRMPGAPPGSAIGRRRPLELRRGGGSPDKVLRFRASERSLHWAIALPFLGCFTTALVLVLLYNPDPTRAYRQVLSILHRVSGLLLITLPILAVTKSRRDFRIHFYNVKQAWVWVLSDIKWLALFGLATLNRRIPLPEQGKFNAAQKLNFMMVMSTYPFYLLTGSLMWITGAALWSWLLHFLMALIATPFLVGHIFMATVPRDTRAALQGMVSGFVDRRWAKHHHARWYREVHGRGPGSARRTGHDPRAGAPDAAASDAPGSGSSGSVAADLPARRSAS